MGDLSVVIVSWNTRALLENCLQSLFVDGGLDDVRAEVWSVDNASSDNSADFVREQFPQVGVIENRTNVGFARANNQALAQAQGRFSLLLNPDTVVPRGAIARLIQALDACPEAAVASPLLRNADGSPQWCWARFPGWKSELTGKLDLSQSPYPLADFERGATAHLSPFFADWVGGACFLVRASAVENAGLLDERFFMYGEETEWCQRFARAGGKTLLVPGVEVTHLGGEASRAVPVETRKRMYQSSIHLYRLLYGPFASLAPIVLATLRYAAFCLRQVFKGKP